MEYVTLNNGITMPKLGFGVFQVEDALLCRQSVGEALATGYRLFDTAAVYLNEQAVGEAIRESGVARDDCFVTSKVWIQDMGYEATLKAFDRTLQRLAMDYLDLYLIHMPFGDVFGTWRAMEKIYAEGRVRAIGVCNFRIPRLADLMSHFEVVPAVNQVETHIFNQQKAMNRYAIAHGIHVEAWSPFAEGQRGFFTHPVLVAIGQKYGRTPAQVALRWLMQRDIIVIPKSVHAFRIRENFMVTDFTLSVEDMAQIEALDMAVPVVGDFDDPDFVTDLCSRKYDL
ncbi:MAG: aldo/keto reductase [Bacteroidales bacterium]|nr:aldo/keto reductase [Bacteroidales bacterium]